MAAEKADDDGDLPGERRGVLASLKWFFTSKYALMERLHHEFDRPLTSAKRRGARARFERLLQHGKHVLRMRLVVNLLLSFGLAATAVTAALRFVPFLGGQETLDRLLGTTAAVSGSGTLLLVALRLAFDRYLARIDVSATFLAMVLFDARARDEV